MIGYQIILAIMPLWLFSHDVSPDSQVKFINMYVSPY